MNESELLFTNLLNCSRHELYLNRQRILDRQESNFISQVLRRRINGEPIQYILGKSDFMGLEFIVTPDVLIPRPETEILVETAVKQVSSISRQTSAINILDLGTGSGCIAVALTRLLNKAKIIAVDISEKALAVARINAKMHRVYDKIKFINSDLFSKVELKKEIFDLIVCNPPYVSSGEICNLQKEIQFEPRLALDGGRDGFNFYRRIIKESPAFLRNNGLLIMEIGIGQAERIKSIFESKADFNIIDIVKDYNWIDRVIVAQKING